MAILFDFKQDYSVGLADFFRKKFKELGGEIVADERYTERRHRVPRAAHDDPLGERPTPIFVPGYYTEVGLIAKQARELGLNVPLLGGDGWDSAKTLEIGGAGRRGLLLLEPLRGGLGQPEGEGLRREHIAVAADIFADPLVAAEAVADEVRRHRHQIALDRR